MPNTPKATDGETPRKRTRKTASVPEYSTNVVKPEKKVAAKIAKAKEVAAVVASPKAPEATLEVKEVKNEVFVMQSLEEKVRARAYELYLRRGGRGGSPEQDWFQAMQEVYGESVA
jgi:Protein of unknown function (DUF2934)